jgi:hypothetical protein
MVMATHKMVGKNMKKAGNHMKPSGSTGKVQAMDHQGPPVKSQRTKTTINWMISSMISHMISI